jgi:RHS repeat-associated protein
VAPTIGFTDHVNDADTGLVYMQHRYYDPVAEWFLSIDSVTTEANAGSSCHRYAYAAPSGQGSACPPTQKTAEFNDPTNQ